VSIDPVVLEAAHQVAIDLKELHLYLHNQIGRALKQYEAHSASRCLLTPPFNISDTVWLDSWNI